MSETKEEKKALRFERLYTAVLLLLVAVLLLFSTLYTGELWAVKAGLIVGLLGISGYFFWQVRVSR